MAVAQKKRKDRDASKATRVIDKDGHRLALLEAASSVIVEYGISGATISRIQEASGLSRGMVHLHFQSKDKLIAAVAKHVEVEYRNNRLQAIAAAGDDPAERLRVYIESEFSHRVLNPKLSAIWMAFRSECNARPDIRPDIETRDTSVYREIYGCMRALAKRNNRPLDCRKAAITIMTMLEGMQTDFHLHLDEFDRDAAKDVCFFVIENLTGEPLTKELH